MLWRRLRVPQTVAAVLLACACDWSADTGAPVRDEPLRSALKIDADAAVQWKLPASLEEISGLALTADGRLFAHDDERAVIYELDYVDGGITKTFAFGDDPVRGDFEGIAVVDRNFVLATSGGELYLGPEGGAGDRVAFERYDTELRDECEFEGLGFDPESRTLLLPCKTIYSGSPAGLKIFAWSIDRKARRPELDVVVSNEELERIGGTPRYAASGIDVDPRNGHRLLISARRPLLLELSPVGEPLAALALPSAKRHRQTEGIAIDPDGMLFLADEGAKRRARLAIYRLTR